MTKSAKMARLEADYPEAAAVVGCAIAVVVSWLSPPDSRDYAAGGDYLAELERRVAAFDRWVGDDLPPGEGEKADSSMSS